jgi:ankyrin repeat protein
MLAENGNHHRIAELLQQIEDSFEAVKQGEQPDISQYALKKVYSYARDQSGKTVLHWASQNGVVETVKLILEYRTATVVTDQLNKPTTKEAFNVMDNQGRTPLHEAAITDQSEIIRLLLKRGAQFNIKDNQGKTPLDYLSSPENSLLKIVNQLFENIREHRPGQVIESLQAFTSPAEDLSAILGARDERNYSLLHWAAREDYSNIVKELLKRGAVYDARDYNCIFEDSDWFELIQEWMDDKKPLKYSVQEVASDPDKLTIVKNARDFCGRTPLHTSGNYFRLKYLIEQGVDLAQQDHDGNLPLHAAVERGDFAVAKLFLAQGPWVAKFPLKK